MIGDVQIKVCGLTRSEDARRAVEFGADSLGFNFYDKSPRSLNLVCFREIRPMLPDVPLVAVSVLPDLSEVKAWLEAGLDLVQIHFSQAETSDEQLEAYSKLVGKEKLWLAPKIAPGESFKGELTDLAGTILWDAYKKDAYGGTGHTSDWEGFRVNRERFPGTCFILAGGLGPDNVREAVLASEAKYLDMASGVEISPGIKDPEKLKAVSKALQSLLP